MTASAVTLQDWGLLEMVYLLATLANDADHMPSLLHALGAELDVTSTGGPETWGVGYYADGRALIIKKPGSILNERSVYGLAPQVRSRIVIACNKPGPNRESAPPFRFRRWLFGFTGNLDPLLGLRETIAEKLPDFIRSEIREHTPGGLAFGMLLAELHRANQLEDVLIDGAQLASALARTTETVLRLSTEAEGGPAKASLVASNGRVVLVSNGGAPIRRKLQAGLERLPDGPPDPAMTDFKELAAALKHFRAVVVAPGPVDGPDWTEIEEGKTLAIDSQLGVTEL